MEILLRGTFDTEPSSYAEMHQVMKEQLTIDNKHAEIARQRQQARKSQRRFTVQFGPVKLYVSHPLTIQQLDEGWSYPTEPQTARGQS